MTLHHALHDELTAAARCLDDLDRTVGRLEQQLGAGSLEVRRIRSDADHLRESLELLRTAHPQAGGTTGAPEVPEIIGIPDAPYDHLKWSECDDEGVGARDRRAP